MSAVIGVLDHEHWLRTKRYCSESDISYEECLANKSTQILSDLSLDLDLCSLPDSVETLLCPHLGVYIFRSERLSSSDIVQATTRCANIKYVEESSQFEIIKPVSDYEEISLLGDEFPTWHHELVGIDKLHSKGLTGQNMQIGVLDSGVDRSVSYLLGKIVAHASFQTDTPVIGGEMSDPFKHGTHVSGIIAGDKIGVAPDASLVVCRIAPEGTTSFDRIVLALEWLCANFPSLRVINLSVGKLDDPSSALKAIVARLQQLDKILVCAIGNDKEGTARTPGNLPDAIGVGAVDSSKQVPDFSSGLTWEDSGCVRSKPDLVLPGVSIPSCIPGNRIVAASGTSQAAPMASGLIALILQAFPNLGYLALRKKLLGLCQDLPVPPNRDGHGLPDASLIGETLTYRGS